MSGESLREASAGAELVKPYGTEGAKGGEVEQMFDNIAPAYDLMNTAMTFGLHKAWRRRALKMVAGSIDGGDVLDVATGTGDLAFYIMRRYAPAYVTGIDLSAGMLSIARKKLEDHADMKSRLSFAEADCLALPFKDESFDVVTVAYGVRNFERLAQGYAEMARVLKPGGRLCVIELCEPSGKLLRGAYGIYSGKIIPAVGRIVSGDSAAYSYLPASIAACPQRDQMTDLIAAAGLEQARWTTLFPGVVAVYLAEKPEK